MSEEQVEEVNVEEVTREAFDVAVEENKGEDEIKLDMIQSGATFKTVTRLYNQFMIDAGLAISKEDRNNAIAEALEGKEFGSEEDFDLAVDSLVVSVKGTTERSAAALVRAYAKKNDLTYFTKPKVSAKINDINKMVCEYMLDKVEFNHEEIFNFIRSCKVDISEGAVATYFRHAERTFYYGVKYHEQNS